MTEPTLSLLWNVVKAVEYVPFALLLGWEVWRGRRRSPARSLTEAGGVWA